MLLLLIIAVLWSRSHFTAERVTFVSFGRQEMSCTGFRTTWGSAAGGTGIQFDYNSRRFSSVDECERHRRTHYPKNGFEWRGSMGMRYPIPVRRTMWERIGFSSSFRAASDSGRGYFFQFIFPYWSAVLVLSIPLACILIRESRSNSRTWSRFPLNDKAGQESGSGGAGTGSVAGTGS